MFTPTLTLPHQGGGKYRVECEAMKNPAARPQGIKLKFFVVIPAKAGIQKKAKDWIPHQVRNDRNKVTLWQRPQGITS